MSFCLPCSSVIWTLFAWLCVTRRRIPSEVLSYWETNRGLTFSPGVYKDKLQSPKGGTADMPWYFITHFTSQGPFCRICLLTCYALDRVGYDHFRCCRFSRLNNFLCLFTLTRGYVQPNQLMMFVTLICDPDQVCLRCRSQKHPSVDNIDDIAWMGKARAPGECPTEQKHLAPWRTVWTAFFYC